MSFFFFFCGYRHGVMFTAICRPSSKTSSGVHAAVAGSPVIYKYERVNGLQTCWGVTFYPVMFLCAEFWDYSNWLSQRRSISLCLSVFFPFFQVSWRNSFLFKHESKEINQSPAALEILIWTQYPWQQLKLWSVGFSSSCTVVKPDYTHTHTHAHAHIHTHTHSDNKTAGQRSFFFSLWWLKVTDCVQSCHLISVTCGTCASQRHMVTCFRVLAAGVLCNVSVSLVAYTCTWREPVGRSIIKM